MSSGEYGRSEARAERFRPQARNLAGDDFGDGRIERALLDRAALSPQELADALADEARRFRGEETPEDDVSIAVVRRTA